MREYEPSARSFSPADTPYGWAFQLIDGSFAMTNLAWEPEAVCNRRVIMLFHSPEDAESWGIARKEKGRPVKFEAK